MRRTAWSASSSRAACAAVAAALGGPGLELRLASRWRERYALAEGDRALAVFDGKGWGRRPVEVVVDDSATVESGLLLFAAFVVRGLAEDASSAAVAGY
jgi:hypothetical protein